VTDEDRPAPAEEERPEQDARPTAGPVPLGSGVLRSLVAEARLIAPEETPPAGDD
jgi:hypothetical protein